MNLWSQLYRHHRWSNLTMIDFLTQLNDEQLALTVPGTYGSSIDTIRHIVSSDADYVRIIPDTPQVTQMSERDTFAGWTSLRQISDEADSVLIEYVDGLTEDLFFVDVDSESGETFELTRSMLLCQIIHHATEHRSQIRTTLSAHGITPPEISTWAWRNSPEGRSILDFQRAEQELS